MAKLHEVLAVEQGLATNANHIVKSVSKNFGNLTLFAGLTKKHSIFDETRQHEKKADEVVAVTSTVGMQLDFLTEEVAPYWNVYAQKEAANQLAKADVVLEDGTVLYEKVPAIVLLGMEEKLKKLVGLFNSIPVLDPAVVWEVEPNADKAGVFRAKHPEERQHTEEKTKYIEVTPATDKHPAQMDKVKETEVLGKYEVTRFSGTISSFEKAAMIKRLAELSRAVKKARMRANEQEVPPMQTDFGVTMLNYVIQGK